MYITWVISLWLPIIVHRDQDSASSLVRTSNKTFFISKGTIRSGTRLSDFRPIALLNVEGELFKCLETHLIHSNKFINNSIQKIVLVWIRFLGVGSIYLSMIWHASKAKRQEPNSLIELSYGWTLQIGSIPHKLIVFALHRYGLFPQWLRLNETYYKGIFQ